MQHPGNTFFDHWLFLPSITGTILLIFTISIFGQSSPLLFEQLTTKDGLSSNKIEAILQDHEGFYWIATQNGLNRYDGTSFKVFQSREGDTSSLTHNFCTSLIEDKNGDIWISTYKGVSRYIRKKGCFQQLFLPHPQKNFEVANSIRSLALDDSGNLWIAGGGLWKYNLQTHELKLFLADPNIPGSISENTYVQKIIYDPFHNGIWLSLSHKINFLHLTDEKFYSAAYNPLHWKIFESNSITPPVVDIAHHVWYVDDDHHELISFNPEENEIHSTRLTIPFDIRKLYLDKNYKLWICDWNLKAEVVDLKTIALASGFFNSFHPDRSEGERINTLYVDDHHNYWIGTDTGIQIYDQSASFYKRYSLIVPRDKGNAKSMTITSMAQTELGYLWIGSHGQLFHYNLITGQIRQVSILPNLDYIGALCPDGNRLWIGAKNMLISLDVQHEKVIKQRSLSNSIYFIQKDTDHHLWVGTWQDGLYKVDRNTLEAEHYHIDSQPLALRYDYLVGSCMDSSDLWIGYNGGNGFSRLSIPDQQITHFNTVQNNTLNANGGTITAITTGRDHTMWLGTYGGGLFQFDPDSKTLNNYKQEQGLESNYINSMLTDSIGNLWISTADGMNYFNTSQHTITSLDLDLVFSSNEVVSNSTRGIDGSLYFFCKDYFIEIDPGLYQVNQEIPRIVISGFKVFDEEKPFTTDEPIIKLTHAQNFFSFEFSAVKTFPGKPVMYSYMLSGFDPEWIESGTKNFASYTNVPGGQYQFQIRTQDESGAWSPVLLNIPIGITPPFWKTWWFVVSTILVIGLTLYLIYRYRVAQLKKIFSLRTKISQDLHDEVGSALSSIHLFSTVATKSLDANPAAAKNALHSIHQNSRNVMEKMSDMVWAINTGEPGGNTLEQRLKNYSYELLSPLDIHCHYHIDQDVERKLQDIEARKNVLLIIKEAMNNIAKYSAASEATVRLNLLDGNLEVEISDNGHGFIPSTKRDGHGMVSMQKRTEELHGRFSVHSSPETGTIIRCIIPIPSIRGTRVNNQT